MSSTRAVTVLVLVISMAQPRILPHNLDAEASVLGGVIVRNEILAQLDTLETEDFYAHPHRVVWEAIRNLEDAHKPIDVVTLEAEVEKADKLDAIGGVGFFGELALRVPTADNVIAYAAIVKDRSVKRQLILAASEIVERGYTEREDTADEHLDFAIGRLSKLDRTRPDQATPIGELVKRRMKQHEELWAARNRGEVVWSGAPTGIKNLDKRIGGYPFGDVSILGARPAMGKTAMNMAAVDACSAAGLGAHVFSQEGGWQMYADRAIARASGVAIERLRNGDMYLGDDAKLRGALMKYGQRKGWLVDPEAGLTPLEIVRRVERNRKANKTRLVVVDYLNILKRNPKLEEHAALEEMINVFGQTAPNTDIAWLIVCQLNRKVEDRPDKRPTKSDLRGSGALEQVARLIVSPYRGDYYTPGEPKQGVDYHCSCGKGAICLHAPTPEQFAAMAQVLILKNSNGQEGYVEASWNGPTTEIW